MKVFEYLLHYNLGYTVRIKRKGVNKKYITWKESNRDWCHIGHRYTSTRN